MAGDIPRLTLALAPETDNVKRVAYDQEPGKDDIEVKFENLLQFLGTPAPCRFFLGKVTHAEKPAPFWQVKGTPKRDEANMEVMQVAVAVSVGGELRGGLSKEAAGVMLRTYIQPDNHVKVILPVLVNNKHIQATSRLFIYKEPEKVEEKKRDAPKMIEEAAC